MAELADAADSKSATHKGVRVQVPPSPPRSRISMMNEQIVDVILSLLSEKNFFLYAGSNYSSKELEFFNEDKVWATIKELESLQLIECVSNYLGSDNNNQYYWVGYGNPLHVCGDKNGNIR